MTPIPRRKAGSEPVTTGSTDTAAPRRQSRPATDGPPPPPGPAAAKPVASRKGPTPQLQKSLEELFSAPAYVYAINGDQWAQDHITENAPKLAEAYYKLAQKNPAVKRTLERLTTGSAWGGVAVATGATVLPLLAHHQLLPAPVQTIFSGVPTTGAPRGPIVPPPPSPGPVRSPTVARPPAPTGTPPGMGGGTPRVPPPSGEMTPPQVPGQPAGTVTVAGSNNRATMVE